MFWLYFFKQSTLLYFNKQYSPIEYERLKNKIIQHMMSTKEYGEFFPPQIALFAYNESIANDYWPLTKEQVLAKSWRWLDKTEKTTLANALICLQCNQPMQIINQEAQFYQANNIRIPKICWRCRQLNRLHIKNPKQLWQRQCAKCGVAITTTYAPERPEVVYCEQCYLSSVV